VDVFRQELSLKKHLLIYFTLIKHPNKDSFFYQAYFAVCIHQQPGLAVMLFPEQGNAQAIEEQDKSSEANGAKCFKRAD